MKVEVNARSQKLSSSTLLPALSKLAMAIKPHLDPAFNFLSLVPEVTSY